MIVKVKCTFPKGELLFATQNIQDGGPTAILVNGGNWQNKIISVSSLSRNIGEDKSYEISGISIEFDDTDRFFRDMMSGKYRYIAGKTVELYTGDDQLIYTGTVEKWQFTGDAFTLHINDKLSGLDTLVPDVYTVGEGADAAEKADGQSTPIIYGEHTASNGAVKCWRVDTGTFLLAGHHCLELTGSEAYTESGSTLSAQLDNNADGNAYILCDVYEDYLRVNVKGKADQSNNLIEDPIDALKDIISLGHIGMGYNAGGMDAAQAVMQERGYKIAAVIDNNRTLKEILADFCFSFDSDFYISKGNEIVITLLKWSELTPAGSFDTNQILDFQVEELPEEIRNKVQYPYLYGHADESYRKTPAYSKASSIENWGEFYFRNEPLNLRYVSDALTAYDVVQRYVIQRKNPRRIAAFSLPLSEFVGIDISDIIEVEHPHAVVQGKRKYQVRRVSIDFLGDVVDVEAVDITSFTGGVLVLGDRAWLTPVPPDTEPTLQPQWSDADEFSRNYGYLSDRETSYFSNNIDYGKVLY